MTTRRITTTTEPATLTQIKALIPINGTDHDARITTLISALRMEAEQITGRSLATSTWQIKLDEFPYEIRLLWPPIVSVESVEYVDADGATQTLSSSLYVVDSHNEPGWILPATDTEWPSTYDTANAVTVNYTAGYGATSPDALKLWMAARIRAEIDGDTSANSRLDGLLDHLKVY